MNNKTFEVEVKDGVLVIPPEIQDYLSQCQGNTKVSITITSSSDNSDDLKEKWERWFDEVERTWFIQCRRYSSASKSTLCKAVDDSLDTCNIIPDVLLIILGCDVTRKAHENYIEYAVQKEVKTPLLWTSSILEAQLYSSRKDLLFSYFGISEAIEMRKQEIGITRQLSIKKRLRQEIMKKTKDINWEKASQYPPYKFQSNLIIIRSVDDISYPTVEEDSGISGWFKLNIWDFYYNGLEVIITSVYGIINKEGKWSLIDYDQSFNQEIYKKIKLLWIGRIPFRNIVEIDTIGDEYYSYPHIYCRFSCGGEPYESYRYILIEQYPISMDQSMRFYLKSNKH